MKYFLYYIIFGVFSFFISSCSIDLSNEDCSNNMNWNTLDDKVKKVFIEAVSIAKYDALINLDSSQITVAHSQKMHSSFAGKNKFKIGNKFFHCPYNIRPPYIFYEKNLYYCGKEKRPNTIEDLRISNFCVISLSNYLNY